MRSETQSTSRTTIQQRSGGARVGVRGGSRTVVGVRTARNDDAVIIKRKKARRYVYSEPSTTMIRKKRYTTYRDPSRTVIVKKRRPGVVVDSGTSTRTNVRTRTDTTVRSSGASRDEVGAKTQVRERSSGQNNVGSPASTEGRAGQSGRGGGQPSGTAPAGSSGGESSAPK